MRALRSLIAASALLVSAPAFGQSGIQYFPQVIPSGTFVGRLSSGPGPTEAISTTALLNALFPNGSAAFPFNAASVAFQGSVNGTVTVQAQAAAGTWTLKWPTSQGTNNQCFKTTVSGSIATTSWANCAFLDANNTWTGTETFNGNLTLASLANFTGTFQANGTTQTFPASGVIVGTSDSQTLTNKSIDASEVNSGTLGCAREPAMTGDATSSAGTCALAIGANKVTRAMEAQGVARSVIGVTGNATANVGDIQGTANQALVVNSAGTALAFGQVNLASSAAVTGTLPVANGGTGDTGTAWTTFTPSVSCGSATFTVNSAKSKTMGKTTWVEIDVTFTAIGTCTNALTFTLPNTAQSGGGMSGREGGVTGKAVACSFSGASVTSACSLADASNYQNSEHLQMSGAYENQ